jgi:hypothetical protein
MKQKLFTIALIISVNTPAFSFEIFNGHIISQKQWSTANTKAIFIKDPNHKFHSNNNQITNTNTKCSGDLYGLTHDISPISAKVGDFVTVRGYHAISIENRSDITKTYTYTHQLCSNTSQGTMQCAYYEENIELKPGGHFSNTSESELPLLFDKPGEYETFVSTTIVGTYDTAITISGDSNSTVTVS